MSLGKIGTRVDQGQCPGKHLSGALVPLVTALLLLVAASCGGTQAPRTAIQLPREATGPSNSPAIQAAFAIQDQLDLPASQSTMQTYLGTRYAGDWIVNN